MNTIVTAPGPGRGTRATLALAALLAVAPGLPAGVPGCLVIAHRGASGYLPEHTLAAYRLAIAQGADFIEPDLVMTADGVLVARHEPGLRRSSNVASIPEFADRATRPAPDADPDVAAVPEPDWQVSDFTLAELRRLRAREPSPGVRRAGAAFDGRFGIPTFAEILALVRAEETRTGRVIGVYPELKSPAWFRARGLDPEGALLRELATAGLYRRVDAVFIQSFEPGSLQRLRPMTPLRLVQLLPLDDGDRGAPLPDFAAIARYADGIGIAKTLVLPDDPALPARARAAGLFVHAWTFRRETALGASLVPEPGTPPAPLPDAAAAVAEMRRFLATGVTGVFTDQPDLGRQACSGR